MGGLCIDIINKITYNKGKEEKNYGSNEYKHPDG
jgi:hypothetical protein